MSYDTIRDTIFKFGGELQGLYSNKVSRDSWLFDSNLNTGLKNKYTSVNTKIRPFASLAEGATQGLRTPLVDIPYTLPTFTILFLFTITFARLNK